VIRYRSQRGSPRYPEISSCNRHLPINLLKIHFNIILQLSNRFSSWPRRLQTQLRMVATCFQSVPHTPTISSYSPKNELLHNLVVIAYITFTQTRVSSLLVYIPFMITLPIKPPFSEAHPTFTLYQTYRVTLICITLGGHYTPDLLHGFRVDVVY
jgi:hypothetical protein